MLGPRCFLKMNKPLDRHSGESRNPGNLIGLGKLWTPAFAGVTTIRVMGFCLRAPLRGY